MKFANQETLPILQIESKESFARVEETASTPGVEALLGDPFDLSISPGIPGEFGKRLLGKALDCWVEVCAKAMIVAGIAFATLALCRDCENRAARLRSYGNDVSVLLRSYKEAVAEPELGTEKRHG